MATNGKNCRQKKCQKWTTEWESYRLHFMSANCNSTSIVHRQQQSWWESLYVKRQRWLIIEWKLCTSLNNGNKFRSCLKKSEFPTFLPPFSYRARTTYYCMMEYMPEKIEFMYRVQIQSTNNVHNRSRTLEKKNTVLLMHVFRSLPDSRISD